MWTRHTGRPWQPAPYRCKSQSRSRMKTSGAASRTLAVPPGGSLRRSSSSPRCAEEGAVHAAIVKLTIDPAQAPAAAAAFTSEILPAIRSAPGLVAAYFVDPADGRGLAFVVFDSEASA